MTYSFLYGLIEMKTNLYIESSRDFKEVQYNRPTVDVTGSRMEMSLWFIQYPSLDNIIKFREEKYKVPQKSQTPKPKWVESFTENSGLPALRHFEFLCRLLYLLLWPKSEYFLLLPIFSVSRQTGYNLLFYSTLLFSCIWHYGPQYSPP